MVNVPTSELAVRRTLGRATASDFGRESAEYRAGGHVQPDWFSWSHRLGSALAGLLDALDQTDATAPRAAGGKGPAPGGHRCPVRVCAVPVAADRLMCRPHWYQVPKPLRDAVRATWRSGAAAGSPEHREAVAAAIWAVNVRQEGGR